MENDLPPDIAELVKQGQARMDEIAAKRATTPEGSIVSRMGKLKDEGYVPEIAAGVTALGTAKYLHGKYQSNLLKNIKMVRDAVDAERNLVRTIQSGAGGIEGSGKTIVDRANRPATEPKGGKFKAGATSRVGTVVPNTTGTAGGLSGMKAKDKIALARRMTAQQMVRGLYRPFTPSHFAETRAALQNPSAEVSTMETKPETKGGKTRTTVSAADIKAGKLLPKELTTGQKIGKFLGSTAPKWIWDAYSSKWVQRPLVGLDMAVTGYNLPRTIRDEETLMRLQKEGKAPDSFLNMALGDSAIRPYVAAGAKGARLATNLYTRYIPELIGAYDMMENMSKYKNQEYESNLASFVKRTGREPTPEEIQELTRATDLGYGFGL